MRKTRLFVTALSVFGWGAAANADIISVDLYVDDTAFSVATGATSLTGPLPDIGNQGTSVTLGDATLTAGNTIFVGSGWSSLIPGGNAIAISGYEDLNVALDSSLATAFGFYFHEPTTDNVKLDGCNATCVDSSFAVQFFLDGVLLDFFTFNLGYEELQDQALFIGFILDEVFDEVRFLEFTGGIDNEFYGEMFVARVPEPGTLVLFGAGLIGLVFTRRRRVA